MAESSLEYQISNFQRLVNEMRKFLLQTATSVWLFMVLDKSYIFNSSQLYFSSFKFPLVL